MTIKQKVIGIIVALGILLIAIFQGGLYSKTQISPVNEPAKQFGQAEDIKVVLTNPFPLDEATILPTQTIEITFNQPIQNEGEFKTHMDPVMDYEAKLSSDRKTAKIKPRSTYNLGQGYTFTVQSDTKFDNKKTLGHDEVFHFQTIPYKGV